MPLRRRHSPNPVEPPKRPLRPPDELVRLYLRGQNLEQMLQVDEAIPLYEEAVAARFDAAGPYDRLIAIYHERESFAEVARIAAAAIANVRTFEDKRAWYEQMRTDAEGTVRDKRGSEF
jgi:tetratricopeptide (TPR) repeat protein